MSENKTRPGATTFLRYARMVVLIYFLAIGVMYVFTIPVGQAPDEPMHLAYINFAATHRRGHPHSGLEDF